MIKKKLAILFISFILFACEKDDDCCPVSIPESGYEAGVIVLNEGNFGSGNSSVSFLNTDADRMENGVFVKVNKYDLGDTSQSIKLFEELAFIVVNVSNRIEIVNRYSFKSIGAINSNLLNPRFVEISGNEIYVTNWGDGSDPDDDYVAVFNLNDFTLNKLIPVAEGPEKIIATNQNLYVAHKGGYGFNNLVTVLDSESKDVVKELEVGYLPNSMVLDGPNLFVLSAGKPSYSGEETAGSLSLININRNEVVESRAFPSVSSHPANLTADNGTFYFTIDKAVYSYKNGENIPSEPEYTLEEVDVLYGFEVKEERLYIASPTPDFTGNGSLFVYDAFSGDLVETYTTGINPNGIYFN
jgi:hypothetical protein